MGGGGVRGKKYIKHIIHIFTNDIPFIFSAGMGTIFATNMLLMCIVFIVVPIILRKIYIEQLKNLPERFVTGSSYSWLMIVSLLISSISIGLTLYEQIKFVHNLILTIVGIFGAFLCCFVSLNILLVYGTPIESMNNMISNIMAEKIILQDLNLVIIKYNELVSAYKFILLCDYSSYVGMLIVSLYNIAMYFSGCHPTAQVRNSNF